jgi:hypothetical protein
MRDIERIRDAVIRAEQIKGISYSPPCHHPWLSCSQPSSELPFSSLSVSKLTTPISLRARTASERFILYSDITLSTVHSRSSAIPVSFRLLNFQFIRHRRCARGEEAGRRRVPGLYAGHSLRAGHATSAAIAGASERSIMNQTGHRSVQMVRRYIRDASLFRENSARQVGALKRSWLRTRSVGTASPATQDDRAQSGCFDHALHGSLAVPTPG